MLNFIINTFYSSLFLKSFQLIKSSRIPVVCMCNDRNHPKIRSLSNHCFDLRFNRPKVEQIRVRTLLVLNLLLLAIMTIHYNDALVKKYLYRLVINFQLNIVILLNLSLGRHAVDLLQRKTQNKSGRAQRVDQRMQSGKKCQSKKLGTFVDIKYMFLFSKATFILSIIFLVKNKI